MTDPRIPPLQLPEIACPIDPQIPKSNNKIRIDSSDIHHPPSLTRSQTLSPIPSILLMAMVVPRFLAPGSCFQINKISAILSIFLAAEMWRVETISVALLYTLFLTFFCPADH